MRDWQRDDDFDPDDIEWCDATVVGSSYEQQFALNADLWRHRHVPSLGAWERGKAPNEAGAWDAASERAARRVFDDQATVEELAAGLAKGGHEAQAALAAMAKPAGCDETHKCATCGARDGTLFYCDEVDGGPWCDRCFDKATNCSDETHGEGCITAVSLMDEGGK